MAEFRVFSDESRHKNERFLLLGGLWIDECLIAEMQREMIQLRNRHGFVNDNGTAVPFVGELKWGKVSTKYLLVYKELVDLFFNWVFTRRCRFCSMLVDTHNGITQSYANIQNVGYYKLLYQMYFHNSKHIPGVYKFYPDQVKNPVQGKIRFAILEGELELALRAHFSAQPRPNVLPLRVVHGITPLNSKDSDFIQAVDVIIGAIGYFQNGLFRKPDAKKAKVQLMEYVVAKMVYSDCLRVIAGNQYMVVRSPVFNIWLFRPNPRANSAS